MPVAKNQEGNIFELLSLKSEKKTDFSENRYAKSITNTTRAPPCAGHCFARWANFGGL
jgi:hypothetical protein